MLHHPETRHFEPGFKLGERLAVALKQQVEKKPPRWVGQRLKNPVFVIHDPNIVTIWSHVKKQKEGIWIVAVA